MASDNKSYVIGFPGLAKGSMIYCRSNEVKAIFQVSDGTAVFIHGLAQPLPTDISPDEIRKLLGWDDAVCYVEKQILC